MRYLLVALLALTVVPAPAYAGKKPTTDSVASTFDVPATLGECVTMLDERQAKLRALVAAGTLAEIPVVADEMQRLATAMPLRSKKLTSAEQAVVQDATGALKQQTGVAGRSATQADQKGLSDALAAIDAALASLDPFQAAQ